MRRREVVLGEARAGRDDAVHVRRDGADEDPDPVEDRARGGSDRAGRADRAGAVRSVRGRAPGAPDAGVSDADSEAEALLADLLERMADQQRQLDATQYQLAELARTGRIGQPEALVVHRDRPWTCASCHRQLATYNVERDELRLRHREWYTWLQLGAGGWVATVCKHCGEVNRQDYTP